jgi:hypothetical protein
MATKTYELQVKLPNKFTQTVRIQADSPQKAKLLAEMQYGKGNVKTLNPKLVKD